MIIIPHDRNCKCFLCTSSPFDIITDDNFLNAIFLLIMILFCCHSLYAIAAVYFGGVVKEYLFTVTNYYLITQGVLFVISMIYNLVR